MTTYLQNCEHMLYKEESRQANKKYLLVNTRDNRRIETAARKRLQSLF